MFIVQLAIPEYRTVKTKGIITKSHTQYTVFIQVNLKDYTAVKRYKDFHNFSKSLQNFGSDIPSIPPKVWSKLSAKVVLLRQQELEKWLQELIIRDELLYPVLEFLNVEAPPAESAEAKVNDGEKVICQVLFRLRLNSKNSSSLLDAFSTEFFRIRQKIKPIYAQQLIVALIPFCSHEFSAAKSVNVLAQLINRSKCLDSKTFEEQLLTFDVEKQRTMKLDQHIRRNIRGDSFESALALLMFIYEHLKSRGEPQTIDHILNNDQSAIEIFRSILEHSTENKSPPTEDFRMSVLGSMAGNWVDVFSLEELVLQRRCCDLVGGEHEIKTEVQIEYGDLDYTVESYIFKRSEWGQELSCDVVEWINEDSLVLHSVFRHLETQRSFDFVVLVKIHREPNKATIEAESTDHVDVPEKLGIQRETLIKTVVSMTRVNDQIQFVLKRRLDRDQMKAVISELDFGRKTLQNLIDFRDYIEMKPAGFRRAVSDKACMPERKIVNFN